MDKRSTFSYLNFMGRNLITWRSKKQKIIVLLSV
uniref:Uncharacterized protein n=1 Tax=Rhizophora mucronata TaxID=61149 RepID=A0A2P2QZD1_RHIMU